MAVVVAALLFADYYSKFVVIVLLLESECESVCGYSIAL